MRSARAVSRAVPDRAPAVLRRRSLGIVDGLLLASTVVIGREVAGRRRGRERAHHEKSDLRRALHLNPQDVIDAALNTPKVTDTSPSQIAEASSPAAIRLERCGSTTCATK